MSRFTVVWLNDARDELAEIWLAAHDRSAVTLAADTIETELVNDAGRKGEPLAEGLRRLIEPPLQVIFEVREADRIVEVARVTFVRN